MNKAKKIVNFDYLISFKVEIQEVCEHAKLFLNYFNVLEKPYKNHKIEISEENRDQITNFLEEKFYQKNSPYAISVSTVSVFTSEQSIDTDYILDQKRKAVDAIVSRIKL